MFTRIQARSFRSLQAIDQSLGRFHALVGPNASGKTTFLDTLAFLGDLMRTRGDVFFTTQIRSTDFEKLVWMGQGPSFQLAVEAPIPPAVREQMAKPESYSHVRYEVEIGFDREANEIGFNHETLWLCSAEPVDKPRQRELFPDEPDASGAIFLKSGRGRKITIRKNVAKNDNFYPDGKKASYRPSFRLGRTKSALANLPADEESFPVCTWFRGLLEKGVQEIVLNSVQMRLPSPPGLGRRFREDGSNLPWIVQELRRDVPRFEAWLNHVRTALEDIRDIATVVQPEDNHCYIVVDYASGGRVPSWLVSDGTLRLLALTLPAYLPNSEGVFLIEEPENGIHPKAIETALQSLSSMYDCQVLVATHSPVAINLLTPDQVLCFAKAGTGATDIVSGSQHPALRDWKGGQPDLGTLFASGILS